MPTSEYLIYCLSRFVCCPVVACSCINIIMESGNLYCYCFQKKGRSFKFRLWSQGARKWSQWDKVEVNIKNLYNSHRHPRGVRKVSSGNILWNKEKITNLLWWTFSVILNMINKYRKKGDPYILLKLKNLLIDYLVRTMMTGYKISNLII